MPKPTPACHLKYHNVTRYQNFGVILRATSRWWEICFWTKWASKLVKTKASAVFKPLWVSSQHLASCINDIQMLCRETAVAHYLHFKPAQKAKGQDEGPGHKQGRRKEKQRRWQIALSEFLSLCITKKDTGYSTTNTSQLNILWWLPPGKRIQAAATKRHPCSKHKQENLSPCVLR